MIKMSDRIKTIRKQKSFSQVELGERIGVSQQVITNYERGIREPSIKMLLKIAGALDVSLETLIGEKPKKPDDQTSRVLQKRFEHIKQLPPEKQIEKNKISIANYSYFSYNYTITYLFLKED
ncbi:MAG: helix-turn-helix domain-containing protein [Chitinivibrionales bacterium]|nr:helix-turn-helix domain-containing protein [Chitinivibrionales bacterium]